MRKIHTVKNVHTGYYLPITDYSIMKNFFDQPVKSGMRVYDNIRKLQQVKEIITVLVVY